MTTRHYILATAGHIDHGKTALVRALTGTDPDRLPEEKARGITIDLGFAHLDLPSPPEVRPPVTSRLGVVDVPGHEDFVRNMVAGVGSIDLALLAVAADDGWMPQTEEHLQILLYLGVTRAVVALTKIDLCADPLALREQVLEKLRDTPLADALLVGTSTITGIGLVELKAALTRAVLDLPPQPDIGKPRLPVDRVFSVKGAGTVVTGTLTGGSIKRGQAVVIQPSGQAARVRAVQTHNSDVESIGPGTRVALNLPDVQAGDASHGSRSGATHRGDVITLPDLGASADTLDVLLERSTRLPPDTRPIKDGARVRLHLGSADVPCRVYFVAGDNELRPGQRAVAQLRFEQPVYAFAADRFILRDWPGRHTLAGGVVLDPDAQRVNSRTGERRALLGARAAAPHDVTAYVRSELARRGVVKRSKLLAKSRFSGADVAEALNRLAQSGDAVAAGEGAMDARWYANLRRSTVANIDTWHDGYPDQTGFPLTALRALTEAASGQLPIHENLLADLYGSGEFAREGDRIRRRDFRPALPPHLQAAGASIRKALDAKPFDPPSRKELAPDAVAQQALRFLLQTKLAVELGTEVVLSAAAYQGAVDLIRNHLSRHGQATVSELKPILGVTRRVMVPLLERLDRDGVTVRRGDVRVLRNR